MSRLGSGLRGVAAGGGGEGASDRVGRDPNARSLSLLPAGEADLSLTAGSPLQVYNEQIHDLLEPKGPLAIREDPEKGVVVQGLSFHQVGVKDGRGF